MDLPINSMVIFHSYVKLPEGIVHVWKMSHLQMIYDDLPINNMVNLSIVMLVYRRV